MIEKIKIKPQITNQPPVKRRNDYELTVIIGGLALGGAEKIVLDWAIRISPSWKVHLVVLRDHLEEWPVAKGIRVTRFHGKDIINSLAKISKDIKTRGNSVCLCHLLKKKERDQLSKSGILTIPVLHNAKQGWLEERPDHNNCPYIISVSEACNKDLIQSGWLGSTSIIKHIPQVRKFAIDTRNKFRQQWNIPKEATVVGMIGAVKPQKNYLRALRIIKEMNRDNEVYLVIIGGPIGRNGKNTWKEVIQEIKTLGIRSRVAMPGFINDASQCLPAFDVVLNTSNYEGLSIATLEALVNKIPMVAAHVGGQGEITSEGLQLIPEDSEEIVWVKALQTSLSLSVQQPSWATFPSYRLWTLAHLGKNVKRTNKVLFVTANLNSGGAQRSLVNLTKGMKRKSCFEIAVCGNSTSSYFFNELKKAKVRVSRTSESKDAFDHAEMLISMICTNNINKVFFWNLDPKVKLLVLKTLSFTNIKFIDVSPGNNSFDEMSKCKEFQQLITYTADQYYERLDKVILKYKGWTPEKCFHKTAVIPNGVPKPKLQKNSYTLLGNPRVVVSGRIAPTKFLIEIIGGIRKLWKKIPHTELHIYGGAEPRHYEYAQAVLECAGEEIDKRIFFHGPNFRTAANLTQFDAYIVLGEDQGCPNALLEALAAGIPSIANDNGGTGEQIINNKTGLLISDCSEELVAEALEKILSDREFAATLGQNGKKHVLNSFSMQKMVTSYTRLGSNESMISIYINRLKALRNNLNNSLFKKINLQGEKNEINSFSV